MPSSTVRHVMVYLDSLDEVEGAPPARRQAIEEFQSIGRWLTRSVCPFLDLERILEVGMGDCEDEPEEHETEHYNALLELHDDFADLIEEFRGTRREYKRFINIMTKAMRDARSQDTCIIKKLMGTAILPFDSTNKPIVPALPPNTKSQRGWSHYATAAALVPMKDLNEFRDTWATYMEKSQRGDIQHTVNDLPAFLYEEGTEYDEERPEKGLFRGHVIIRVPSKGQAEIHGMRSVTPEAVAYAAVQAYINLSSLEHWDRWFNHFDVEVFFYMCTDLFKKCPDKAWVDDTLQFLTSQLPSLQRQKKSKRKGREVDPFADSVDASDPTGILSQWKARVDAQPTNNNPSSNDQPTASRSAMPPSQPTASHRQPAPQAPLAPPTGGPTAQPSRTQLQPAPAAVAPPAHHHLSPTVQPAQPAREFRRLQRDRPGGDDATRSDEDNEDNANTELPSPPPKKMAKRAPPPKRVSARRGRGGKTLN
ncbi:hypothetical protein CPC08DRAFT_728945 [Agrocybe pediades]|nr:hypothetical protein CPC08DRAFT_728945 [Agrocybe pediades]